MATDLDVATLDAFGPHPGRRLPLPAPAPEEDPDGYVVRDFTGQPIAQVLADGTVVDVRAWRI